MLYLLERPDKYVFSDDEDKLQEYIRHNEGGVSFHKEDGTSWFLKEAGKAKPSEVMYHTYEEFTIKGLLLHILRNHDIEKETILLVEDMESEDYIINFIKLLQLSMYDEEFFELFDGFSANLDFTQAELFLIREIRIMRKDSGLYMEVEFDINIDDRFRKEFLSILEEKFILFEVVWE